LLESETRSPIVAGAPVMCHRQIPVIRRWLAIMSCGARRSAGANTLWR